jgi:hypothetical protein
MLVTLLGFRFRRFPLTRSLLQSASHRAPEEAPHGSCEPVRSYPISTNRPQFRKTGSSTIWTPERIPTLENSSSCELVVIGYQCSPACAASTGLSLCRLRLAQKTSRSGSGISASRQSVATAGFTRSPVTRASLSCLPPRGFASLGLGLRFSLCFLPPPSLALGRCLIPTNA